MQPCILIGGQSRRMGRPKALLPREGVANAQRLAQLSTDVCGEPAAFLGSALPGLKGRFISDRIVGEGPLSAILGAMDVFPGQVLLILSCDLPWLQVEGIEWLLARAESAVSVWPKFPTSTFPEPLISIYQPGLFQPLNHSFLKGNRGLVRLFKDLPLTCPHIPTPLLHQFRSANTPEEWPPEPAQP